MAKNSIKLPKNIRKTISKTSALLSVGCLLPLILAPAMVKAAGADSDGDGISDHDEAYVYMTDPYAKDTDLDGYSDWIELNTGYSPHNKLRVKLEDNDNDSDGLSDRMELNFGTDLTDPDSDGDGFTDGEEIASGYDPNSAARKKLPKTIKIDTHTQTLEYFLGQVRLGRFKVSTGKSTTPTPPGIYRITTKIKKAWSRPYGLWMPYWLGLDTGKFGIHELPIWPGGYREGENHLGIPVSHGCIRLGVGPAEILYNWAEFGIPVHVN